MKIRFHTCKIPGTKEKLVIVLTYVFLITLFDSYSYGIIYQQKIKQEGYTNPVWSWVFEESGKETGTEHITVPRYRVVQKSLEAIGLVAVFYFCGFWCLLGLLLSHYLLSYDLLFYIVLNKTYLLAEFERANSAYWLRYPYQAGYFFLNPFRTSNFYLLGAGGLIIATVSCFIKTKMR